MARRTLLLIVLILSAFLLTLHMLALKQFLYFSYWWLDVLMHVLGGFTVGLLACSVLYLNGLRRKTILLISIVSAVFLSVFWELFEYRIGMTFVIPHHLDRYIIDTISDLVCGITGGAIAGYIAGITMKR